MSRTAIIVSPYFPPSTLAGVHRARHLAKHLPAAGWTPIVLCVDEAHHEERLDPGLASLVPASVEVVKVGALPARLTRPFGVGEISLRAWGPLRRALFRLLATRPVGAVVITGSPYYPMLLAREIKARFNVPVVLDFQDPWVSAWGARRPAASKDGLSHWLATLLEPRALRGADHITSVSPTQNSEMSARHPWLDRSRMSAIPIGGDPEDFDHLRKKGPGAPAGVPAAGCTNLSFVGTCMPRTAPLLTTLLRAYRLLRQQQPRVAARLRLNFVGTSNQPDDYTTHLVRPLSQTEGVADAVYEVPQRVPYLEALSTLSRSDGVLLVGSDEPHYTASKIYPALMSGRPFLSLFHASSSSHQILTAAGGGIAHSFRSADELDSLVPELANSLSRLVQAPEQLGSVDPRAYAPYEARAIAARYAQIFDSIAMQPA